MSAKPNRSTNLIRYTAAAPKFDDYGLHAEDCACVRCEAGYRPSEMQRDAARRSAAAAAAAGASGARRAAKLAEAREKIDSDVEYTRRRLADLHAAHAAADRDPRSKLFHELRSKGVSLPDALAEVDRQFPDGGTTDADES